MQGVNIYKDKVNILIAKKEETDLQINEIKKILVQYLITKIIYRLT